jgi:hypothetical protein
LLRALPVGAGYPAPRFEEDGAEDDSAGRGAGAGMLATRLCFLPQAPANRQQATSATLAVSDLRRGITFSSSFNSPGARNLQTVPFIGRRNRSMLFSDAKTKSESCVSGSPSGEHAVRQTAPCEFFS